MLRDEYGAHRGGCAGWITWYPMYLPFYPDHCSHAMYEEIKKKIRTIAYGPAHSYRPGLVRMTALHMLAQREQCARCASPRRISICAHGDISTVTVARPLEIEVYAANSRIYHVPCAWAHFFCDGFTITFCTRLISRGTRLKARAAEIREQVC